MKKNEKNRKCESMASDCSILNDMSSSSYHPATVYRVLMLTLTLLYDVVTQIIIISI